MLTDIAYKVPKDKKAVLGKMAYYLEGVKEFPKQLSQNMTLTFNSKEYSGTEDIMLFLVANSRVSEVLQTRPLLHLFLTDI